MICRFILIATIKEEGNKHLHITNVNTILMLTILLSSKTEKKTGNRTLDLIDKAIIPI